MVKPVTHGIIDLDCNKILKIVASKAKEKYVGTERTSKDYDSEEYKILSKHYNNKEILYRWWAYDWSQFIPDSFFTVTQIKKEPFTCVVIEVLPGTITPPHIDNYNQLSWGKNINKKNIARFWIPITKPILGHALFFDDECVYNIEQGTIIEIPQGARHSACNAGLKPRIYMSVIGVREGPWIKDEN